LDTGHNQLAASTGGNALKVCRSFQCGAQHILYHTTWCQSGGWFFPWLGRYQVQKIKKIGVTLREKVVERQFV
jgi:hypothetical protein